MSCRLVVFVILIVSDDGVEMVVISGMLICVVLCMSL